MKAKHIPNTNLPLSQQSYNELRKGLKLGTLKWSRFSKELKNAYHYFEIADRKTDFKKKLHQKTESEYDYETPI